MVKCNSCVLLSKLFEFVTSNRGYWLLTELFLELHKGKDYCDSSASDSIQTAQGTE